MRKLVVSGFLAAIAAGALGFAAAFTAVSAQTPTPAPTPTSTPTATPTASQTPTPTPTATAVPTSTITIRFVRNGEPVSFVGNLGHVLADGVSCQVAVTDAPIEIRPVIKVPWPLGDGDEQPPECMKGPPTTVRFEFGGEFGSLAGEVVWTGSDVTLDIEVPPLVATPTATAGDLPPTGAAPGERSSTLPIVVALVIAALMIPASVVLSLRSRK
jgi:hypothetical protein